MPPYGRGRITLYKTLTSMTLSTTQNAQPLLNAPTKRGYNMSVMIGGEADVACPDTTSNGSDLRCPTHASGYRVAGGRASGNDRPGRPAAR